MANLVRVGCGNPYLRYDADNDQIQAMNTDGQWVNIYATDQLPLPAHLWIIQNGEYKNNASLVNTQHSFTQTLSSGTRVITGSGANWAGGRFTFDGNLQDYSSLVIEGYTDDTAYGELGLSNSMAPYNATINPYTKTTTLQTVTLAINSTHVCVGIMLNIGYKWNIKNMYLTNS